MANITSSPRSQRRPPGNGLPPTHQQADRFTGGKPLRADVDPHSEGRPARNRAPSRSQSTDLRSTKVANFSGESMNRHVSVTSDQPWSTCSPTPRPALVSEYGSFSTRASTRPARSQQRYAVVPVARTRWSMDSEHRKKQRHCPVPTCSTKACQSQGCRAGGNRSLPSRRNSTLPTTCPEARTMISLPPQQHREEPPA